MFNHEETFNIQSTVMCHLKGSELRKSLFIGNLEEEALLQVWLTVQLMRKLMWNGRVK